MYYYVREPTADSHFSEGFATQVVINSELQNGRICIDGAINGIVGYGDSIINTVRPEF
jgi:hypothetical protein